MKAVRDTGAATIVVVGPLHPDLFGGETPMIVEVTEREAKRLRRHRRAHRHAGRCARGER